MKTFGIATAGLAALSLTSAAMAVDIDNGVPVGTVGSVQLDVRSGGELEDYTLTATRADNGAIVSENLIFDYFSYVNVGSGGFRLDSVLINDASLTEGGVVSNGSFAGSAGNTINWNVVSSIQPGGTLFTNTFQFSAEQGTLGDLQLIQYLDEDVFSVSDDVLFTRGSAAAGDLQVFTVDGATGIGVAQGGALSEGQGLVNAEFDGFAADTFDNQRPQIAAGTETYALDGTIDNLASTTNPFIDGTVFGPRDVVSALAWSVNGGASNATIITTLGGVPDITDIPDDVDNPVIPTPSAAAAGLALLGGLVIRRRRH